MIYAGTEDLAVGPTSWNTTGGTFFVNRLDVNGTSYGFVFIAWGF